MSKDLSRAVLDLKNHLVNVHNVDIINVMNVDQINALLLNGELDKKGLFPKIEILEKSKVQFEFDFGLPRLPSEAGILFIRGPRQFGKSTWLEMTLKQHIEKYGAGSGLYLNGDEIVNSDQLLVKLRELVNLFSPKAKHKVIFIDEITALKHWEKSLKILSDRNELSDILVVTTGSKATDLKRGQEKLPGRKGRLNRSDYLFLPISYSEFSKKTKNLLGKNTLLSYLLTGGSPIACLEIAVNREIPEYVVTLTKDWVFGETALAGRDRSSLLSAFEVFYRFGGSPVGQTKLAKHAGLANNTVAAGYVDFLQNLVCVGTSNYWDIHKNRIDRKKPAKFHFINLLVALAFSQNRIRSVADFLALAPEAQGMWWEWLVAQEIHRRQALAFSDLPEYFYYWRNSEHEIDFVNFQNQFIEVKRGGSSALEFKWFPKLFPKKKLLVLNKKSFSSQYVTGIGFEEWLLVN